LLLGFSLFVACSGCKKTTQGKSQEQFEIDKSYERGPLTVHVRLDKSKITIAETLLLEFEAAIEPDYEMQMPRIDKILENFGIVDWDDLGEKLNENNNIVTNRQYRLEPFLSGTYAIPAFTFEFHPAVSPRLQEADANYPASNGTQDANSIEAKKYKLLTEPIDIEVTSLLGEQHAELKIADIEDVVEMPKEASFWWVWTLAGAVAMAGIAGWLYLRRKRKTCLVRIFKPAHELAYERLRALIKDDLITVGKIKEFYERISDILRRYIEHRFDLRAPERTTDEFLTELQWTDALSTTDKESLGEFLRHCDLVKFAKYNPTAEQIQRTFDLVKDFIEKTKSEEQKVDVTNRVSAEEPVAIGST